MTRAATRGPSARRARPGGTVCARDTRPDPRRPPAQEHADAPAGGRTPLRFRPAGTTPASPRRRPGPGRRGRTRAGWSPAPGGSVPNSASPARAPPTPAGPRVKTSPRRRRAPAPAPRAGGPAAPASRCRARNRDGPRPGRRARRRRTPSASASRHCIQEIREWPVARPLPGCPARGADPPQIVEVRLDRRGQLLVRAAHRARFRRVRSDLQASPPKCPRRLPARETPGERLFGIGTSR